MSEGGSEQHRRFTLLVGWTTGLLTASGIMAAWEGSYLLAVFLSIAPLVVVFIEVRTGLFGLRNTDQGAIAMGSSVNSRDRPTCPQHGTKLESCREHFHCPDCAEFGNGFHGRVSVLGPEVDRYV